MFERSCTPIDTFFLFLPSPQCRSSCRSIRDFMEEDVNFTPLTTAHPRKGLIPRISSLTEIETFEGFTSYSDNPVSRSRKPRIALAAPSTL